MTPFSFETKPIDRGVSVRIAGRATADQSQTIDSTFDGIIAGSPDIVVLDCAGLEFIGSFFIGALVRLGTELQGPGRLRIAAAPDGVLEALRQSRLDDRFPLYATVEEACR